MHLLNTCIVPWFDGGAVVNIRSVSLAEARLLVADGAVSHIGHQATAEILTGLLGQPVAMDRKPWDGCGKALIFQCHTRLEEGKIYTTAEMAALKFGFRLMDIDRE